jgi:hypothetical protein
MKAVLYVAGSFVAMALAALLITWGKAPDSNPLMMLAFIGLFAVPPVGAFWMMYQAIRFEKSPFALIGLAFFIPFTFVWYYFERYRPDRARRTPERFGSDIAD